MRHIKNFNENVGNENLFDRTQRDVSKEETSTTDPTEELMKVLKPYFDENGLEGTKEYLTNILDNFDYDDFIEYHYGKK